MEGDCSSRDTGCRAKTCPIGRAARASWGRSWSFSSCLPSCLPHSSTPTVSVWPLGHSVLDVVWQDQGGDIDPVGRTGRGRVARVVVTAVAQSVLGGIGLAIVRVPFAAVLTAVMFMLAIAQVGAMIVLVPAVVWLYRSGSIGWGTFLLVRALMVGALDSFLRPILIKKGADLPLLLIFAGVVGGLISLGLIGIFVGPVVLAVSHTLLTAWVDDDIAEESRARQALGLVRPGRTNRSVRLPLG